MRILYIDIDSLRPDHLGCYGYHRDTSARGELPGYMDRLHATGRAHLAARLAARHPNALPPASE